MGDITDHHYQAKCPHIEFFTKGSLYAQQDAFKLFVSLTKYANKNAALMRKGDIFPW